jgi:hypothetical protein
VWAADLDGRAAALAEAMRFGIDALLVEDGLHPIGGSEGRSAAAVGDRRSAETMTGRTAPGTSAVPVPPAAVTAAAAEVADGVAGNLDRHADGSSPSAWPEPAWQAGRTPERTNGRGAAARPNTKPAAAAVAVQTPVEPEDDDYFDPSPDEPVLTAEELRALLQDQPDLPPTR